METVYSLPYANTLADIAVIGTGSVGAFIHLLDSS
jgi:hypothetical protein